MSTMMQLVSGNCSNRSLTGRCSLNSTEHNSRSHKDSDHIFDDQKKPTHTILFKDNVYGSSDDGSRSVKAEVFTRSDEVNVENIKRKSKLENLDEINGEGNEELRWLGFEVNINIHKMVIGLEKKRKMGRKIEYGGRNESGGSRRP